MDWNVRAHWRFIGYGGNHVVKAGRSYKVLSQLGQGAFGAVYLADTLGTGLERRVAIKLLRPEKATIPGLLGRLRDEARMLSVIRHRSIVRVDDLLELDGAWAIIMEYVEGCDIAELLKLGPVPPVAALSLCEEVAAALHAAYHQAGPDGTPLKLIHRDIKPSNLRLTAQGELKILDFGVARADLAKREEATEDAAFGTVPYMSPERFYGEDSHAGDIYALGVTLFEMLTGVKPGKTAMDSDRQPPGERLRAQWTWLAEISMPLHDLIAAMLAKKPADRPTARETVKLCSTIRGALPGDSLDEWAERVVPGALRVQVDQRSTASDRTGTILFERSGSVPIQVETPASSALPVWLAGTSAVFVGGALTLLVLVPLVYFGLTLEGPAAGGSPVVAAPAPVASPPVGPSIPQLANSAVGPTPAPTPAAAAPAGAGSPAPSSSSPTAGGAAKPAVAVEGASTKLATISAEGGSSKVAAAPSAKAGSAAAPPPEVVAEPAVPSGPGRVALSGDAKSAVVTGGGQEFTQGEVPPGTYTVVVTFTNDTSVTLRAVVVDPGKTTTIRCSASFSNCKVQREP